MAKIGAGCMLAVVLLAVLTVSAGVLVPVVYLLVRDNSWPAWVWGPSLTLVVLWLVWQAFGKRGAKSEESGGWSVEGGRRGAQAPYVAGPFEGQAIAHHRALGGSSSYWSTRPVVVDMSREDGLWEGDGAVGRRFIDGHRDLLSQIGMEVRDGD